MKISFNDRQNLLSETAVRQTEEKLSAALSKFGSRISRITVSVYDINGPRGGTDMECRLVAKIKKMGEVVAIVRDDSLTKSIRRAIIRIERNVARRIQKNSVIDHDRRSDLGFAFFR